MFFLISFTRYLYPYIFMVPDYSSPISFCQFHTNGKTDPILRFFIMYSFFPLVTVLLAKGLGFLDSIYLKTQKDRIIPYIACGIYYFWMCYVLRNQPNFPKRWYNCQWQFLLLPPLV